MAYFADLTPYRYSSSSIDMLNVGWLDQKHPFAVGTVEPRYLRALIICAKYPRNLYRGFHCCNLDDGCGLGNTKVSSEGIQARFGNGEIRVTAEDGQVYAAPTTITHYVQAHQYQPPEIFLRAALVLANKTPILTPLEIERIKGLSVADCYDLLLEVSKAQVKRSPSRKAEIHREYAHIGQLIREESWDDLDRKARAILEQRANEPPTEEVMRVERALMEFGRLARDPTQHEHLRETAASLVERALLWEIRVKIP